MNDVQKEWTGESNELKGGPQNIFPTDEQAKALYQMQSGKALNLEFNTGWRSYSWKNGCNYKKLIVLMECGATSQ
ncbi:MAG TPA: hypothetical protein VMW04_04030 [Patescibacteria group bacterium]|nr:hypothetical protein [Patescibacteria group bacterium]